MSAVQLTNQSSRRGNVSPTSTQRVARWRERKRRGVLYTLNLEIIGRDLRVLKRCAHLASDDPRVVGKHEVADALACLLDGLANRLGVFEAGAEASA